MVIHMSRQSSYQDKDGRPTGADQTHRPGNPIRRLYNACVRQSSITAASVSGLLVMLMAAGIVGLFINRHVNEVAQQALRYDVQLEDRGDDLRAAALEVRHYHRNLIFTGPTRGGMADFEAAHQELQRDIDQLEELGIADEPVPQPAQLRELASSYYANFRPAIDLYSTDQQAFNMASDQGLVQLGQIEAAAQEIDRLGEQHAAASLTNVERASRTATFDLLAVVAGLALFGVMLAFLAVRRDNEIRRLYAEQQATAEQLAHALHARNNFIADASHELRTPITVLRGNAEVALDLDSTGVHVPFLLDIVKESTRMSRLIEDLLFLARSDFESPPLELECISARTLLAGLPDTVEVLAGQRHATIEIDLQGDGELCVDPARIEQAVLILVDNAIKYGMGEGPITLWSATRAGELIISVDDRGPGIPPEDLPFIFERFYRVDKTRARKRGGVGLGLAIAMSIVQAHGGRLDAYSWINEGTTMTIRLQLETASASANSSTSPLARRVTETASFNSSAQS